MTRSMDDLIDLMLTAQRLERFRQIAARRLACMLLICENFADLHNVSACLRSVESFGIGRVMVVADERYKSSRKITRAAHRWLQIERYAQIHEAIAAARADGFSIVGTLCAPPARPYDELELPEKMALIVGNEHDGLSPEAAARCDATVYVPTFGFTQSLNVSVATGILLQSFTAAYRQRGPEVLWDADTQAARVRAWCERDVQSKLTRNQRRAK